jgi:hypothetical protein
MSTKKREVIWGGWIMGADHADLEARVLVPLPLMRHTPLQAASPHDQVDGTTGDYAVQVGASR